MTQLQTSRRFYIDRADDQPVVRTVPVRVPAREQVSAATHQVTRPAEQPVTRSRTRLSPQRVTQLVRTARRRTHLPRS